MSALTDVQAAVTSLTSAEAELSSPDVNATVVEAVVSALTSAGYTVAAPAVDSTEPELPAGGSDDSATV